MDAQLKRGLLDGCVLAVLYSGESYGYKIVKDIEPAVDISESTLYPILKRLEADGRVCGRSVEHNGRLRKYYTITASGMLKLAEFRNDWRDVTRIYEFIAKKAGQETPNDEEASAT